MDRQKVTVGLRSIIQDGKFAFSRDQDDTVEAHYVCLERPCACIEGWVFVGYIDEHGEEREASYRCRRCGDSG